MRRFHISCAMSLSLLFLSAFIAFAAAPGPKVSELGNRHNLSSANTGVTYHATGASAADTQICIFCHTPHNATVSEQAPLWNLAFSSQTFQRYTGSSTFRIKNLPVSQYQQGAQGAQPNGSSKLCLSCHDGVSDMSKVLRGGPVTLNQNVITGLSSFKPTATTNKMRYGHHPVSFVYATGYTYTSYQASTPHETQSGTVIAGLPVDYVFPQTIDGLHKVKLKDTYRDGRGWMQCTTCHDAHQNQSYDSIGDVNACYNSSGVLGTCDATTFTRKVAPFWVSHSGTNTATQDHDAVCNACHALTTPKPWP